MINHLTETAKSQKRLSLPGIEPGTLNVYKTHMITTTLQRQRDLSFCGVGICNVYAL